MPIIRPFGTLYTHTLTTYRENIALNHGISVDDFRFAVDQMPRLRAQFADNPLVQRMARITERTIRHYGGDFYFHDLFWLSTHPEDFYWFVRPNGTHLIPAAVSREDWDRKHAVLQAIQHQGYDSLACYYADRGRQTLRVVKPEAIVLRQTA
ncbi:MAG: hypothetical protein M1499_05375 [Firmicutes bacterium]|nr:hypothetical protein [Bacillota bacterium]